MTRRSCRILGLIAALTALPAILIAEDQPNALLNMGSGNTGAWTTELLIANPTNTPIDIQIGGFSVPIFCPTNPCPPPDPTNRTVPASGQITVHITDIWSGPFFMQFLYVLPTNPSDPLPVVRARNYEVANPGRAMELPITSYAALAARQNSPLDFPGAERSATAHSNLVIAEVGQFSPASARIDAITDDGTTVGSKNVSLATGQTLFVIDILTTMGLQEFSGHLRVTYTGGGGIIDGALATLTNDSGFAVSAGFNP
jgi:hypothetical protein